MPGHILAVNVHAANISDTTLGASVLERAFEKYPSLERVCGDAGYRGTFVLAALAIGLPVDIIERISQKWEKLPKRWCVERTFGWLNGQRRLSKDYEILSCTAESMIYIAHSSMLLKRF
jgi:putative transposase